MKPSKKTLISEDESDNFIEELTSNLETNKLNKDLVLSDDGKAFSFAARKEDKGTKVRKPPLKPLSASAQKKLDKRISVPQSVKDSLKIKLKPSPAFFQTPTASSSKLRAEKPTRDDERDVGDNGDVDGHSMRVVGNGRDDREKTPQHLPSPSTHTITSSNEESSPPAKEKPKKKSKKYKRSYISETSDDEESSPPAKEKPKKKSKKYKRRYMSETSDDDNSCPPVKVKSKKNVSKKDKRRCLESSDENSCPSPKAKLNRQSCNDNVTSPPPKGSSKKRKRVRKILKKRGGQLLVCSEDCDICHKKNCGECDRCVAKKRCSTRACADYQEKRKAITEKNRLCPQCGRKFKYVFLLTRHRNLNKCETVKKEGRRCKECLAELESLAQVRLHEAEFPLHSGVEIRCTLRSCRMYLHPQSLSRHVKKHGSIKKK